MQYSKRAIQRQLGSISASLRKKILSGDLVVAVDEKTFICGEHVAFKTDEGFVVRSDSREDDICEPLSLVESAILVAYYSQKCNIMEMNHVIAMDALCVRHARNVELHSQSVKTAIKANNFEQKDVMYSRFLFAKDRMTFYRRKIKNKSNIIVQKR